jgi:hypothetical protein
MPGRLARHRHPGARRLALAQHAPPDLQEECLPLLEDAVRRHDASRRVLAYLMDRMLMHQGQPQVYGT